MHWPYYVFHGLLQLLQLCKHGYLQANFHCIVDKRFTWLYHAKFWIVLIFLYIIIGYIWLHDLETSSLEINNTSFSVLFYKKVLERQCNETNEGGTTSIISWVKAHDSERLHTAFFMLLPTITHLLLCFCDTEFLRMSIHFCWLLSWIILRNLVGCT